MAEDLMIGFKFNENDKDIAKDAAVWDASDKLFNEFATDAGFEHLRASVEAGQDDMKAARDVAHSGDFENFDFTEGFDFAF